MVLPLGTGSMDRRVHGLARYDTVNYTTYRACGLSSFLELALTSVKPWLTNF